MKIIIAGSREFDDYGLLCRSCDKIINFWKIKTPVFEIVSGGALGADRLGEWYAGEKNYKCTIMKADWKNDGRGAGYIRNEKMARYVRNDPDGMLIAFWNGISKGTKNMIDIADNYGLKVHVIEFQNKNGGIYE